MFWPHIHIGGSFRPSRTVSEAEKDTEKYALDSSRAMLSSVMGTCIDRFRRQYYQNIQFYKGRQWTENDVKTFLMDGKSSNQRAALKRNVVTPMVTRIKGAARNMSINVAVKPRTSRTRTRKEAELARNLILADAAGTSKAMRAAIQAQNPLIGDDEDQTRATFENIYQDKLTRGLSHMLQVNALINKFDERKEDYAERLTLSGLCAAHGSIHGNHIVWDMIEPEELIWDTSAKLPDFSDGDFMCVCPQMSISSIAERWPDTDKETIKAIEDALRNDANPDNTQRKNFPEGRPRVFTIYWKDVKFVERAYVMKDGGPELCVVSEPDPKTGKLEYTKDDYVDPPTEALFAEDFKGGRSKRSAVEVIRYCSFIPWEYAPGVKVPNDVHDRTWGETKMDLVLDHGLYPLQEDDPFDTNRIGFPIKVSTWAYIDGDVIAPITDSIDPQRFINRVQSVIEMYLRKMKPPNKLFDARAVDPSIMDMAAVNKAAEEGETIYLDGKNGGINQAYAYMNGGLDAGVASLFELINRAVDDANASTGINSPAQGQQSTDAVGVTAMLLQQTNIILMPLFGAVEDLYRQKHQFNAQAGRSWYWRNPHKLEEMIGDEDLAAVIASKDTMLEKWRSEVKMVLDEEVRLKEGQTILTQFLQFGLIDKRRFADLFNRATIEEVVAASREYVGEEMEAAKQQQRANEVGAQLTALGQQEAELQARQDQLYSDAKDEASKDADRQTKLSLPAVSNQSKAVFEQESNNTRL